VWAGPPDHFITFTCNPNWPEIHDFLKVINGQKPIDHPNIVARLIHDKLNQLLDDLIKKLFGDVIAGKAHFTLLCLWSLIPFPLKYTDENLFYLADLSIVEFQKRGLPQYHIL